MTEKITEKFGLTQWKYITQKIVFSSDPGVSGVQSMGPVVSHKLTHLFADLTDVTLADEDANPILTDNANRAIQGNVAMRVTLPGGQLWIQCK